MANRIHTKVKSGNEEIEKVLLKTVLVQPSFESKNDLKNMLRSSQYGDAEPEVYEESQDVIDNDNSDENQSKESNG